MSKDDISLRSIFEETNFARVFSHRSNKNYTATIYTKDGERGFDFRGKFRKLKDYIEDTTIIEKSNHPRK